VDVKNLADLYSLPVVDWNAITARLDQGLTQAPGTGGPDRHTCWLARDPRCTLSVAANEFDLVVEGDAQKVTDPPVVAAMAKRWAAEGWPCRVDESGRALTADFSAPSAGPPPWFVYRVTPRGATALSIPEPGGATRWRF
jgi:hypothetical protein